MYSCLFPVCALNFSSVCDVFVRCLDEKITFKVRLLVLALKGATSRFVHLEKISLNFSSWLFAIRFNLRHP